MAVVDVSDIEGSALTAQAAGAEGGQAALVRQLCQRVVLIHELGQRRGAEEFLDDRRDRADVDEALRRDGVEILHGHALADDALEAGEADAELILQQFAHAAQAAVAEVVDVVRRARADDDAVEIVDGGEDIVARDVLRDELIAALLNGILPASGAAPLSCSSISNRTLRQTFSWMPYCSGSKSTKFCHVDHVVREDLDLACRPRRRPRR